MAKFVATTVVVGKVTKARERMVTLEDGQEVLVTNMTVADYATDMLINVTAWGKRGFPLDVLVGSIIRVAGEERPIDTWVSDGRVYARRKLVGSFKVITWSEKAREFFGQKAEAKA